MGSGGLVRVVALMMRSREDVYFNQSL